jgi:hypothetical protein
MLTAVQTAEVIAYIAGPEIQAWEQKLSLKFAKKRGDPSPVERYKASLKEKMAATRNGISAKRHAAKLNRTPQWADLMAIKEIYRIARSLTVSTGIKHHVDHVIPLQGKLVSGLHTEANLQILMWRENMIKNNKFEVAE